jgi:hypothetical protein
VDGVDGLVQQLEFKSPLPGSFEKFLGRGVGGDENNPAGRKMKAVRAL